MSPDRFTTKTSEALRRAIDIAHERRHAQTAPEHLLAALLEQDDSLVPGILRKVGVALAEVRARADEALAALPTLAEAQEPATSQELLQVLRAAEHEMRELRDEYISAEHLLLSLAGHGGRAGDALRDVGLT